MVVSSGCYVRSPVLTMDAQTDTIEPEPLNAGTADSYTNKVSERYSDTYSERNAVSYSEHIVHN